jgi:HlyD family secretion protein
MNKNSRTVSDKKKQGLIIASVLVVLAVIGCLTVYYSGIAGSGQPVARTMQVVRGDLIETVDGTGVVEAKPGVQLSWESSGYVDDFSLSIGDYVVEGTTLLNIRDETRTSEILQAESSLLEAQAELDKMVAADADLIAALEDVRYQERLLTNKYSMRHEFYSSDVSDARIEAVYANYNQAREEVRGLEEAYAKVKRLDEKDPERVRAYEALQVGILKRDSLLRALSQIMGTPYGQRTEGYFIAYDQQKQATAEARAAYERLLDNSEEIAAARATVQALQNTINHASIIAPFNGTITAIHPITGGYVRNGDIAVQLDDLTHLVVDLEVTQMDINRIEIGQSANITLPALPNSVYTGTVTEISGAGAADGNGNTTFQVTVAIAHPDSQIKTGFNAAISIIVDQVEDALLVPNTAIQYGDDGKAFVISMNSLGISTTVPVEIGIRTDTLSELVEGELEEDDQLVVAQMDGESVQDSQPRGFRFPFLNFPR